MLKRILLLLFIVVLLWPCPVAAARQQTAVKRCGIFLDVGEDGILHEEQTLEIDFASDAPFAVDLHKAYALWVTQADGTQAEKSYAAKFFNISVTGMEHRIDEPSPDIIRITLLPADAGLKRATISYDIDPGDDRLSALDFLYRDFIWGDQADPIEELCIQVAMPGPFDVSLLSVVRGEADGTSVPIDHASASQTITATAQNVLPGQWVTLSLLLEDGFFSKSGAAAFERIGENFDIQNYSVQASVSEQNAVHISEDVTVSFYSPQHGIVRDIPTLYTMDWEENGQTVRKTYRVPVDNITVDGQPFEIDRRDAYVRIKIGDANEMVSGVRQYTLSYDMSIGDDRLASRDFFYMNLIGTGWPVAVNQADMTIVLPKPFDAQKVWFYIGAHGAVGEGVDFAVSGNTVRANTTKQLMPYEGVTCQVDLPQGYFAVPDTTDFTIFFAGLLLAPALAGVILYLLSGKRKKAVQTVEFMPPNGLTPAEAGYVIDGHVDHKDILSLIIYWAGKRLIRIEQSGGKSFALHKLKELPKDATAAEAAVFQGIFRDKKTATEASLKDSFYDVIQYAKQLVLQSFNAYSGRQIFDSRSKILQTVSLFVSGLPAFCFCAYAFYHNGMSAALSAVVGAFFYGSSVLCVWLVQKLRRHWRTAAPAARAWRSALLLVVLADAWGLGFLFGFREETALFYAAAAVSFALCALLCIVMRKRTEKGTELLGRILGLKNFITHTEKDRIEKLVMRDPHYFYRVLPYAYVLGVTDKWIKQFERIVVPAGNDFDFAFPLTFYAGVNAVLESMQSVLTHHASAYSDYDGGSFGGGSAGDGGSSGGGFGGGGGDSW